MFLGTFEAKLLNNRLTLPVKFRQEIVGDVLVLTEGLEKNIWGFSMLGFEDISKELMEKSLDDLEALRQRRKFFGLAEVCKVDRQGRVVLPFKLIKIADLKRDLILIGAGKYFEIWSKESSINFK